MNPDVLLSIVGTLLAVVVLYLAYVFMASGGSFARYWQSQALLRRMLRDPGLEARLRAAAVSKPAAPPTPPKPSGEPLRLLTLLQREGRLLDFLLEDIQSYSNDQIGAAVRDIHRGCRKALQDHLDLTPVLPGTEGTAADVPAGFDPSAIRLTGNVTGTPPFKGTLLHHGWRVTAIKIPKPPAGQDEFVVQPAEVELP